MDLKKREQKIEEKRKKTNYKDFVRDICSWTPLVFHKKNGKISRFPNKQKTFLDILSIEEFENYRSHLIDFGQNYNFEISFFENIKSLFSRTKLPNMLHFGKTQNSNFADIVVSSSNVYLSSVVTFDSENVLYSQHVRMNSNNVLNSTMVRDNCDNVYFGVGVINSYNIFFSKYLVGCDNIRFSKNLVGCHECIFCNNLENQKYCINNKKYNKDEYIIEKEEILKQKKDFQKRNSEILDKGKNIGSQNNTNSGFCIESFDTENTDYIYRVKDARNVLFRGGTDSGESVYDGYSGGSPYGNNIYGGNHIGKSEKIYCCSNLIDCSNIYYSYNLELCSYCIGCIGLKNKSFCILNKQYSKDERFQLADKIFEQMNNDGILGDFFPGSMNPFYFNDTVAHLIDDSITKEELSSLGYKRRNEEIKVDIPDGLETINSSDLDNYQGFDSNGNLYINPDILKKVIIDAKGNSYRIIKMEYNFLMKHGLPLPEIHWLDRIKLGFKFK